jgi:hypothetical protein
MNAAVFMHCDWHFEYLELGQLCSVEYLPFGRICCIQAVFGGDYSTLNACSLCIYWFCKQLLFLVLFI